MALADLTFKLYNDAGGVEEFSGTLPMTHETDLSDNDQDFVLYFMSLIADRQLEQTDNPGVNQITLTPTDTIDDWAATTAYVLGDTIEPTTPNTFAYVCTTAGTSGGSEPTFPVSGIGSTVVDGTAVWSLRGKRHEITEVKLALTSAGLDTATAGAALDIGTTLSSGTGNLVEVHIRITNAVTTVSNTSGSPDFSAYINSVDETSV